MLSFDLWQSSSHVLIYVHVSTVLVGVVHVMYILMYTATNLGVLGPESWPLHKVLQYRRVSKTSLECRPGARTCEKRSQKCWM